MLTMSHWGRAMIAVPLKLYKYYGDVNVLKMRYSTMGEYINYFKNRAGGKPYLNDGGLGDWLTLGELALHPLKPPLLTHIHRYNYT